MVALCAAAPNLGEEPAQEQATRPRLRGYFTVRRPAQGVDMEAIKGEIAKSATLPLWTFDSPSSRDGNSYPGAMVGLDPFTSPGSVSVPTKVVPVIIRTHQVGVSVDPTTGIVTTKPGITTFNPSIADTACLTAPNNVPTTLLGNRRSFNR